MDFMLKLYNVFVFGFGGQQRSVGSGQSRGRETVQPWSKANKQVKRMRKASKMAIKTAETTKARAAKTMCAGCGCRKEGMERVKE